MNRTWAIFVGFCASGALAGESGLTVYNDNFAVVRQTIPLSLQRGVNDVVFSDTTAHLEPDSVILRDPSGRRRLLIREQNYRADPLSQQLLLSLFEGQTIDFLVGEKTVRGRIVRSGYVPHRRAWRRYGEQYMYAQMAYAGPSVLGGGGGTPIIEIDGKMRFGLPGTPLFPSLGAETIMKPTLHWQLETDLDGPLDAELAYVTGGMSWKADYNVIADQEEPDRVSILGWVTIDNQSGRDFVDTRIKLMAGDVHKLDPAAGVGGFGARVRAAGESLGQPAVSAKVFDEYHLYKLARNTTLRDRETKQVEFVRADDVRADKVFVYEGAQIDESYSNWDVHHIRAKADYGVRSNPKVWIMREFKNTKENGLGIPLPGGRMRFYQQDDDRQLEFVGENDIDHTPKSEKVRVYTGNAFDLVGQRTQTHFHVDHNARWTDEAFEITLRNHKDVPVEVRVVERLYRWYNWDVAEQSMEFRKIDARTIEFPVTVPPNGEKRVTYKVHYSW